MVHLRGFDGYPLCWPVDKWGPFKSSHKEEDVTCPECIESFEEN